MIWRFIRSFADVCVGPPNNVYGRGGAGVPRCCQVLGKAGLPIIIRNKYKGRESEERVCLGILAVDQEWLEGQNRGRRVRSAFAATGVKKIFVGWPFWKVRFQEGGLLATTNVA